MSESDDIDNMHYAVSKSLSEVKAHKARIKILLAYVSDMAEGDCSYNDECPDSTLNRRGRCRSCKARLALEEYNAATRDSNSR